MLSIPRGISGIKTINWTLNNEEVGATLWLDLLREHYQHLKCNISYYICTLFCCALFWFGYFTQFLVDLCDNFTHILQGCFTGIGAIVWLLQCQWSNPEGHGLNQSIPNQTKHNKAWMIILVSNVCPYSRFAWLLWQQISVAHGASELDVFDWISLETYRNMSASNDGNLPSGAYEILIQSFCLQLWSMLYL